MTIGTANQETLSFIKEVTPGTTPATPAMQLLRITGESLQATLSTTTSEEIRDDRATGDLVPTDQSITGEVNVEASGATFDELLEAALFSDATWTSIDNGGEITISSDATGFLDSGSGFVSAGIEVGQFINFTGFTDTTIDGFYRVLTVAIGEVTTFPAPTAVEAAGATVTYKGSTIKSGSTDHSYTFQKTFQDIAVETYNNFRGCRVGTLSQTLAVGSLATMAFGITGLNSEITTTQIAGLTEVAKTTTDILNAIGDVTNITAVGTTITGTYFFTDLSLSYDNQLRELKAIGNLGSIDVRPGTIAATATLNPYFESKELLDAFLANDSFLLSWQLTASDGYSYIFSIPKVKFVSQTLGAGSKDTDLIINAETQALKDPLSGVAAMRIDRFTP
jgi:hypothetical protein